MFLRPLTASCFAVAALLLAGCDHVPLNMGMGAGAQAVAATPFTTVEREFVTKVAAKGMYEVEVSKLAAERALNPNVRAFAEMMVRDHTQMNNELVAMMAARGIAPPRGLAADKTAKLHKLAALPRSDAFDNGYLRVVGIEDHRSAIATFEKGRRDAKSPELRTWIDRTLLSLRNHLAAAQGIASSIAG